MGRRVSKTINGVTTRYLWNGTEVLAETDGQGKLLMSYVHGIEADEVLYQTNHSTGEILYFHQDHLMSTLALTTTTGAVKESYTYDVYGSMLTGPFAKSTRFLYTGREWDKETELYYNRARFYDPSLGRFISSDPKGYAAGLNLYTYTQNNPLTFRDPEGTDVYWGGSGGGWFGYSGGNGGSGGSHSSGYRNAVYQNQSKQSSGSSGAYRSSEVTNKVSISINGSSAQSSKSFAGSGGAGSYYYSGGGVGSGSGGGGGGGPGPWNNRQTSEDFVSSAALEGRGSPINIDGSLTTSSNSKKTSFNFLQTSTPNGVRLPSRNVSDTGLRFPGALPQSLLGGGASVSMPSSYTLRHFIKGTQMFNSFQEESQFYMALDNRNNLERDIFPHQHISVKSAKVLGNFIEGGFEKVATSQFKSYLKKLTEGAVSRLFD